MLSFLFLNVRQKIFFNEKAGAIRKRRPALFHEHELGAEVRHHALLLGRRPAPVERQDDDARARHAGEDQQVLDAVLERDAHHVALREPQRIEMAAGLADEPIEVAIQHRALAVHDRRSVWDRARVVGEGFGDVHAPGANRCGCSRT